MSRLVGLSGFACLLLVAACVDTGKPAKVTDCEKANQCKPESGGAGGGHSDGGLAGVGGSTSGGGLAGAGGSAVGGKGGVPTTGGATSKDAGAGGAGGGSTGASGGAAGHDPGVGGAGSGGTGAGGKGGEAGNGGGGSTEPIDANFDTPVTDTDGGVKSDTNPPMPDAPADVPVDTVSPAPETGPDLGRDTLLDITPDRMPDRMPDVSPDTISCIQKFKDNGYAISGAGTTDAAVQACSNCKENTLSLEAPCKTMVDCLQLAWPCAEGATCWIDCQNKVTGGNVLIDCVKALTHQVCPAP
jgi:hypothetical protein